MQRSACCLAGLTPHGLFIVTHTHKHTHTHTHTQTHTHTYPPEAALKAVLPSSSSGSYFHPSGSEGLMRTTVCEINGSVSGLVCQPLNHSRAASMRKYPEVVLKKSLCHPSKGSSCELLLQSAVPRRSH
ncbi:unnamed protein product [Gadus morhua 'NCC']